MKNIMEIKARIYDILEKQGELQNKIQELENEKIKLVKIINENKNVGGDR
jgi:hypothetical protein